jgi:tetratricopeptide (TPR) repeat protein
MTLALTEKRYLAFIFWLIVAFILYGNTLSHDFVLDDGLVITNNSFTQKGIAGIPEIFLHDTYYPYYQQFSRENLLEQGRYRPLSVATFAVEQSFFGNNAKIRHFGNVVLYGVMMFFVFLFLKKFFFREQPFALLAVSLLFAAHPIHTEVVANIKGRDEILMLLFLAASLLVFFKAYESENNEKKLLPLSGVLFLLSLLSKETGIVFLFLLPALNYYLRGKEAFSRKYWFGYTIFSGFGFFYMILRFAIVGFGGDEVKDILNNPYALADAQTAFLTKMVVLSEYFFKAIFPIKLSFDYSYAHFPYVTDINFALIFSLVLHGSLFSAAVVSLFRRDMWGFGIWLYLSSILLVSNILVSIGATMADRLLHLPLLGFYIFGGLLLVKMQKYFINFERYLKIALAVYLVLFTVRTWKRNTDWTNNETLFLRDVETVPNSLKANVAASSSAILAGDRNLNQTEKANFYRKAIEFSERAESIYPDFVEIYINRGVAYSRLENLEKAKENWEKARKIFPSYDMKQYDNTLSEMYMREGLRLGAKNKFADARENFDKGLKYNPLNPDLWFHRGGAFFAEQKLDSAIACFEKSLKIRPGYREALNALGTAKNMRESQKVPE